MSERAHPIVIFTAMMKEQDYQVAKWGNNPHSISEWLHIMHHELLEAAMGASEAEMLREILQVMTVGLSCLIDHGVIERDSFVPIGHGGGRIDHVSGASETARAGKEGSSGLR